MLPGIDLAIRAAVLIRALVAHRRYGRSCATLALAVLWRAVGAVFWPLLPASASTPSRTRFTFFYPVFALLHGALRAGRAAALDAVHVRRLPAVRRGPDRRALSAVAAGGLLLPSPVDGFLLLRVFHVAWRCSGRSRWRGRSGVGAGRRRVGGTRRSGFGSFVSRSSTTPTCWRRRSGCPGSWPASSWRFAHQGWVGPRPARRWRRWSRRAGARHPRPAVDADRRAARGLRAGAPGLDAPMRRELGARGAAPLPGDRDYWWTPWRRSSSSGRSVR